MIHAELEAVVIVSCRFEWQATLALFPGVEIPSSPFGGWGKISAAASAQYVIDRWRPDLLINLGTCGGFRGETERGEILLVERTIVYDIVEQITDPEAAAKGPPQPDRLRRSRFDR